MINRRNFLALIPSLSAIPLIGKEIIQGKDRITIIKPEPVKIENPTIASFDMTHCKLQLIFNEQVIGEGYLTEIHIENPLDISTRDSDGYSVSFGQRSIQVSGQLYNFHL